MSSDGSRFLKNGNEKVFLFMNIFLFLAAVSFQFIAEDGMGGGGDVEAGRSFSRRWSSVIVQLIKRVGSGVTVSSHWSDLAFFGPVPFISGDETGLFAAGLAAEPSLLVSCSHLTCVAGP